MKKFLPDINNEWTLFLDRDGVINREIENDYVKSPVEFEFYPGVLHALSQLSGIFRYIIVVTNQRGVGKGVMTEEDLLKVHSKMKQAVENAGGRIDAIYSCTDIQPDSNCRKPNTGMALRAKADYPGIDFAQSLMAGNNLSDMQFGRNAGMYTAFIKSTNPAQAEDLSIDLLTEDLADLAGSILKAINR